MSDIKRTAQLMLVAEYKNLGIEPQACALMAQGHQPGGVHHAAVQAIIAALTPPEGYVDASAVLDAATRLRSKASSYPMARTGYMKAAEEIEMAVSAARPEVK